MSNYFFWKNPFLKIRRSSPKFPKLPRRSPDDLYLHWSLIFGLKLFKKAVEWAIKWRDQNTKINKKILRELGLDENTEISNLGRYHKDEFRRLKYIFHSKNTMVKRYPEPEVRVFSELKTFTPKSQESSIELFKSMKNTDDSESEESTKISDSIRSSGD